MNPTDTAPHRALRDVAETRFALAVASSLTEQSQRVAPEIGERLRFARSLALEAARRQHAAADVGQRLGESTSGTATLGFSRSRWWFRLASALPAIALVIGLVLIQTREAQTQISVAAEIDAALLGGDLPIGAYRDAGFTEFLKTPPRE